MIKKRLTKIVTLMSYLFDRNFKINKLNDKQTTLGVNNATPNVI